MLLDTNRQNTILHPRPYHQTSPSTTYSSHRQPDSYGSTLQTFHADASSIDLDFDAELGASSLSSSPVSTQSLLSQYSAVQNSPLSAFDSIPTVAAPRGTNAASLFDFPSHRSHSALNEPSASLFANSDLMQTDTWLPSGHLTPRTAGRISHHRESSLSSLGSNGPASPYSHNTSNPHIAVTDSAPDAYHCLPGNTDDFNYQLAKSYPAVTHDNFYTSYPNYASADNSVIASFPRNAANPRRKPGQSLLPPDHLIGSRPVSVASSIASDSPATPAEEAEEHRRQRVIGSAVPKLDRTMTDIYADELYNPNFTIGSVTPSQVPISPSSNGLFAQRLQAANNQHLNAVQSPISATSSDRSPFRAGSPMAPVPLQDFPTGFPSQQQMREQSKAVQDARAVQQHMKRNAVTSTPPTTISPQDAMLEFHETDSDANFPLFPQSDTNNFDVDAITKAVTQGQQAFDTLALDTSAFNSYLGSSQMSAGLQVPQQYPFIAQARPQSSVPSLTNGSLAPSRMGSTDTGMDSSNGSSPQRPTATSADGGTYTCTYHGCTLRFETPALLQKHKREGHRQAHGLGGARRPDTVSPGIPASLFNSQAGPHRCDRINPSTGKPCNTIFSRPYDLTRHEDTIHNARKQKVRCDLCTDEKTFSRADALTRHYRVCHPDVEFQGKHRRRAGQSA